MKKIVLILLLLFIAAGIVSSNSSAQFYIKAYKNTVTDANPTSLFVTDAITSDTEANADGSSLNNLGNGNNLDLSSYLSDLVGNTPEKAVFSYRVESKESGTFTITISNLVDPSSIQAADGFNPSAGAFYYYDADGAKYSEDYPSIQFEWALKNVAFSSDGPGASCNDESSKQVLGPAPGSTFLQDQWTVTNSDKSVWYRRGAVALAINSENLSAAEYGQYMTTVQVKLAVV